MSSQPLSSGHLPADTEAQGEWSVYITVTNATLWLCKLPALTLNPLYHVNNPVLTGRLWSTGLNRQL